MAETVPGLTIKNADTGQDVAYKMVRDAKFPASVTVKLEGKAPDKIEIDYAKFVGKGAGQQEVRIDSPTDIKALTIDAGPGSFNFALGNPKDSVRIITPPEHARPSIVARDVTDIKIGGEYSQGFGTHILAQNAKGDVYTYSPSIRIKGVDVGDIEIGNLDPKGQFQGVKVKDTLGAVAVGTR